MEAGWKFSPVVGPLLKSVPPTLQEKEGGRKGRKERGGETWGQTEVFDLIGVKIHHSLLSGGGCRVYSVGLHKC